MSKIPIPVDDLIFAIRSLLETMAAQSCTQLEKRVDNWQIRLYRIKNTIRIDLKKNPIVREPSKSVDT